MILEASYVILADWLTLSIEYNKIGVSFGATIALKNVIKDGFDRFQ